MVTTNSNAYITAGPPKFQNGSLGIQSWCFTALTTLKAKFKLATYDLAIRSDIARCHLRIHQRPNSGNLSCMFMQMAKPRKLQLSYPKKTIGYVFQRKVSLISNPTIKVRLSQEAVRQRLPRLQAASAKPAAMQRKPQLHALKGKTTKKVTAVNPKCPTGYKKK